MKLVKDQKKAEATIPVVAMSDIAFLLIIFFLVTTNFVKESHIRLKLPKAEAANKEDRIQTSVSVDEDGSIWVNGAASSLSGLQSDVGNLLGKRTGEHRKVFVKCHKDLTRSEFMPVIEKINAAGGILVLKTDDISTAEKENSLKRRELKKAFNEAAGEASPPAAAASREEKP